MPPAPANNEAVAPLSPFFTPSPTAPLAERDCNNISNTTIACPAVACALRRGASFLDAEDACLALPNKASFLIPEDSYLPGQENCASAVPAAPASVIETSGTAASGAPSAPGSRVALGTLASTLAGASGLSCSSSHACLPRQRLCTPFLLLDPSSFDEAGFDEEGLFGAGGRGVDAASECFAKAVQALEMVEQRSLTAHSQPQTGHAGNTPQPQAPASAPGPAQADPRQPYTTAAELCTTTPYDATSAAGTTPAYDDAQQVTARRASSLAGCASPPSLCSSPSPLASSLPGAATAAMGQWCEPSMIEAPQRPASVGPLIAPAGVLGADDSSDASSAAAAAAAAAMAAAAAASGSPYAAAGVCVTPDGMLALPGCFPPPGWPVGGLSDAACVGVGVVPGGGFVTAAPEHWSAAEAAEAASQQAAAVAAAAAAAEAPAPAPAPKAFHHKTGGPCDHCGATESPQWRRGPPAKPMLCNACGTRYRRTNQLNPAAAYTPAGRAAAAAAAAQQQQQPASKQRGGKRDAHHGGSSGATAAKRGRTGGYY